MFYIYLEYLIKKMRFHCACVMAFLPVMATVIDATVWFGDHKEFPITNAIAMVERELKPRHIDKAVYLSVSAHKEIKDLRSPCDVVVLKDVILPFIK